MGEVAARAIRTIPTIIQQILVLKEVSIHGLR